MYFANSRYFSIVNIILCHAFSDIISSVQGARILGIFPIASYSHHSVIQPIVRGLAARGHNVTILSNFKNSDFHIDNYTELVFNNDGKLPSFVDTINLDEIYRPYQSGTFHVIEMFQVIEQIGCDLTLKHEFIQALLKSKIEKIDLLIVESYSNFCYQMLALKFNVPLINVCAPGVNYFFNDFHIGNINNPSYVPLLPFSLTTRMNFTQRLLNTFRYVLHYWHYIYYVYYAFDWQHLTKMLDMEEVPDFEELRKKQSLNLVNNHNSIMSLPKAPNSINIGGIHIKPPKPLSKHIKQIIDNAKQGVIFLSFGTSIKASSIPKSKLLIFKNVFARIPQTVFWRVDDPNVIEMPENVIALEWLPQRDILAHNNVKAFISHCGLMGIQEAIYTATPVLGIPLYIDQLQNANILMEKGAAVVLDYFSLTEASLVEALDHIVNNTRFRKNMKNLSNIFNDRLVSPLEEALYWVEFVLRNKGAQVLRTPAADLPLYQYLLLDVFLIIFAMLSTFLGISYYIIKKIIRFYFKIQKKE